MCVGLRSEPGNGGTAVAADEEAYLCDQDEHERCECRQDESEEGVTDIEEYGVCSVTKLLTCSFVLVSDPSVSHASLFDPSIPKSATRVSWR